MRTDGGDRNARDLRSMAREERIRAGENQESVFGGFEMYTKVPYFIALGLCMTDNCVY